MILNDQGINQVISASTGNHGQGVSLAASMLNKTA